MVGLLSCALVMCWAHECLLSMLLTRSVILSSDVHAVVPPRSASVRAMGAGTSGAIAVIILYTRSNAGGRPTHPIRDYTPK